MSSDGNGTITKGGPSSDDVVAGSVLLLISGVGIALYTFVIAIFIKKKFAKDCPAFYIIISMGVVEIYMLLISVWFSLMILAQNAFVPKYIHSLVINTAWAVDNLHLAIAVTQRFAAIFGVLYFPSLKFVLTAKFCIGALIFSWVAGSLYYVLAFVLYSHIVGSGFDYTMWCFLPLNFDYLDQISRYWLVYNCTFTTYNMVVSIPTVIRVVYHSRTAGSNGGNNNASSMTNEKEKSLVYITALHSTVLLCNNISQNIISLRADNKWVRLLIQADFQLNFFCCPIIYVCVNKALKQAIKEILFKKAGATATVVPLTSRSGATRSQKNGNGKDNHTATSTLPGQAA